MPFSEDNLKANKHWSLLSDTKLHFMFVRVL